MVEKIEKKDKNEINHFLSWLKSSYMGHLQPEEHEVRLQA